MMFFGKCALQLNDQSELTLPIDYRKAMSKTAYLTQGFDRNLYLLSQEAFTTLSSHLSSTSISDPLSRLLRRLLLGGAAEIVVDEMGQVKLPPELCEYAGLEQEIILVGQGEYLEIWSSSLWEQEMENLKNPGTNTHQFEKFNLPLD
jgi:MraZ protein